MVIRKGSALGEKKSPPMIARSRRLVGLVAGAAILLTTAAVLALHSESGVSVLRRLGILTPRRLTEEYLVRIEAFSSENSHLSAECLMIVGDSLVQSFPTRAMTDADWVNRGVSGDRVIDLSSRLGPSAVYSPCTVVAVLIGTNDIVVDAREPRAVALDVISLVDRLSSHGKKVVAHTIPPTRHPHKDALPRIQRANRIIRSQARSRSVALLDLESLLRGEDGQLLADYSKDGVHLTPAAYAKWTKRLAEEVDQLH